jgi:hypothetical protein
VTATGNVTRFDSIAVGAPDQGRRQAIINPGVDVNQLL